MVRNATQERSSSVRSPPQPSTFSLPGNEPRPRRSPRRGLRRTKPPLLLRKGQTRPASSRTSLPELARGPSGQSDGERRGNPPPTHPARRSIPAFASLVARNRTVPFFQRNPPRVGPRRRWELIAEGVEQKHMSTSPNGDQDVHDDAASAGRPPTYVASLYPSMLSSPLFSKIFAKFERFGKRLRPGSLLDAP